MQRTMALSALLIGASLNVASAADLPYKAPPPPPPPILSWTGCYVDAGVGYGLWRQDHTTTTVFGLNGVPTIATTVPQDDGGRGWLGRFGAGCDYQAGRFVIGVFGDYDAMSLTGTNSPLEVGGNPVFAGNFPLLANEKESGAWSIGGRIGYLVAPSVLTYVNAGYTRTRFDAQAFINNLGIPSGTVAGFQTGYTAQTYNGWFLGGGVETSLAGWVPGLPSGLFLRTEYRYSDYSRVDLTEIILATGAPVVNGAGGNNIEHTRPYVETVTTSVVWKFNWGGPVAARY